MGSNGAGRRERKGKHLGLDGIYGFGRETWAAVGGGSSLSALNALTTQRLEVPTAPTGKEIEVPSSGCPLRPCSYYRQALCLRESQPLTEIVVAWIDQGSSDVGLNVGRAELRPDGSCTLLFEGVVM